MHNVWILIRREYLERVRSKSFLIFTLLMPAFMAGVVIIPVKLAEMKSGARRIVIVTNNPEMAAAVKQQLEQNASAPTTSELGERRPESYVVSIDTTLTEDQRSYRLRQVSEGKIDGFLWLSNEALAQHKVTFLSRQAADFQQSRELGDAVTTALAKHRLAGKGMSGPEVDGR